MEAFKFTDAEWRTYQNLRDLDYSHREYLEYVVNSRLHDAAAKRLVDEVGHKCTCSQPEVNESKASEMVDAIRDMTAPFPQHETAHAKFGPGGWWWDEQVGRIADGNRDLYLGTIRARWEAMTPRQQDRFTRRYSIIGIAIRHLVDDGIIAAILRGPRLVNFQGSNFPDRQRSRLSAKRNGQCLTGCGSGTGSFPITVTGLGGSM